jgi:tRNA 2-thiouridine synthesizing protein A
MAVQKLELLGLKCPQPILKIAAEAPKIPAGEILEVLADCESFPRDIEAWCKKTGRTLLFCRDEGGKFNAQIQF